MDALYFPLTAAFAFLAGALFIAAFATEAERRKARSELGGSPGGSEVSFIFRALAPFAALFIPAIEHWGLPSYREKTNRKIINAGLRFKLAVDEFIAYKLILAGLLPAVILVILRPGHFILIGTFAGMVGFFFPDLWLYDCIQSRNRKILKALPYIVDMLALCVQAGLDFSAAISQVVDKAERSPLIEELEMFLTEMRLGRTRRQALEDISERVGLADMRSFCSVLVQADALGTSISEVLQAQAEKMRGERFQRAEKAAAAASQKILFPIVLFILPSVFVIILGLLVVYFVYSSPLG